MSNSLRHGPEGPALEAAIIDALAMADRIGAHVASIHLSAALDAVQGNQGPWTEDDVLAAIEKHSGTI